MEQDSPVHVSGDIDTSEKNTPGQDLMINIRFTSLLNDEMISFVCLREDGLK